MIEMRYELHCQDKTAADFEGRSQLNDFETFGECISAAKRLKATALDAFGSDDIYSFEVYDVVMNSYQDLIIE